MSYNYSQVDHDNQKWFSNDLRYGTLLELSLRSGSIRGLKPFSLPLTYPITAIAGPNGSGKSTILALATCAFHNEASGFRRHDRKMPYYTFADFFVQTQDEIPPEGLAIWYKIAWNRWAKSARMPNGEGIGWQTRKKPRGGKWTDYSGRVDRNVVFLGINRIVPHSEIQAHKTYKRFFSPAGNQPFLPTVCQIVGRIMCKDYSSLIYKSHGKYKIPIVEAGGIKYSGFNMGAGENSMFDLFSTILSAPLGLLVVIDEIELGLHPEAQKRMIIELKKICLSRHCQIISTTHSPVILDSLPPESRFFIINLPDKTDFLQGISPEYAAGLLSSENSAEISVFLEDNIAKRVVQGALPQELRIRSNLHVIGSASLLCMELAAAYRIDPKKKVLAIFDGDQKDKIGELTKLFSRYLERIDAKNDVSVWFQQHISFLPSETWPEKWLLETFSTILSDSHVKFLGGTIHQISTFIRTALRAGKHSEFFSLSEQLGLDEESVISYIATSVMSEKGDEFKEPIKKINEIIAL